MLASYRVHEMGVTRCANAGPVSLAHNGLPLPHCMQGILPSYKAKNFSDLALLAMQHYRRAAQLEAGNPPRNGAVRDFEEINAFCSW